MWEVGGLASSNGQHADLLFFLLLNTDYVQSTDIAAMAKI